MRGLLVMVAVLCAACTPTTYDPMRDRPDYVQRVLEDVTAMLEGMANAHTADRVVVRDLNFRSGIAPGVQPGGIGVPRPRDPAAMSPQ